MTGYTKPAPTARVLLQAEPEPLEIDVRRTAVIVIDMQNAFLSRDGMFDLIGAEISNIRKAIEPCKKVTGAARAKRLKVVYTMHNYSPDLRDSGGKNSPNWYKEGSLISYREHLKWRDKLLIRGTWGADIVEELKPQEGDIVVEKQRYSAFCGTNLDIILKTYNIKYLAFTGVTTNICVEASLRDAFYLEYFPILISDAALTSSSPFSQDAAIVNVKLCYGWVTTTEDFAKSIG